MTVGQSRLALVGCGGLGLLSVALVPSCAGDECTVGILPIAESAPSLTDRLCGDPAGESLATAISTNCSLEQCAAVCPIIEPHDPDDVATLVSCQHVIPGRPATTSSGSGAGLGGSLGFGGFGGEPGLGGSGGEAGAGGVVGLGGAGGVVGLGGAGGVVGLGGASAHATQKPSFACAYEIETLFCE